MSEVMPVYRISSRYLGNLWQQAFYSGLGILVGWGVFLIASRWLVPGMPLAAIGQLPVRLLTDSRLWMMPAADEICELIRWGIGPGLAFCAFLSGLAEFSSWSAVRYEVYPGFLRMRWRRLSREIEWELIHGVDERPHREASRRSLRVSQNGRPPILVRGLEDLPGFIDLLQSRLPRLTKWHVATLRIDLTSRLTNFVIGVLLIVPFSLTWLAYYVAGWKLIELFWSVVLMVVATWIWFRKPMSRSQVCVREVEVVLALAIVILSGTITFINWMESPSPLPVVSRFLGW